MSETGGRYGTTNVEVENLDPKDILRLTRLGRELRLTDMMLAREVDTLSIVASGRAPAWTTLEGDHIAFSMTHMPMPKGAAEVRIWLGTNAHELGHVKFSPRADSILMTRVIDAERTLFMPGLAKVHNIVEDQRQERLVLARYAAWRNYLVAALGHHLHADSPNAWLLLCGRTWLPQSVRDKARAAFASSRGDVMAARVAELVGDYQRLTDPGDGEQALAWAILDELHSMFEDDLPSTTCTTVIGEGEPDTDPDDGRVDDYFPTADEADEEQDDADDDEDGDDDADAEGEGEPCEDGEPGDADADADADDGEGDDEGEGEGDTGGDTGDADGDGEGDDADEDEGDTEVSTSGGGGSTDDVFDIDEIRKELEEAAGQIDDANDERGADELDDVLDTLDNGHAGKDTAEGDKPKGQFAEPSDTAIRLRYEVGDALLDIKEDSEPGWIRRTDSGRINSRRLMDDDVEIDQLFDRFEPGQMDSTEMEVVLLLDVSGSMDKVLTQVAEASWAIEQAVDDVEGSTTVITYDSGPHRIVSDAATRPDPRMFVPVDLGGTVPTTALAEAYRLLSNSSATNRLMVVLTDGEWDGDVERQHQLIAEMRASGITTALAFLPTEYGGGTMVAHGCEVAERIDEPHGLARLFQRVAEERIRVNLG